LGRKAADLACLDIEQGTVQRTLDLAAEQVALAQFHVLVRAAILDCIEATAVDVGDAKSGVADFVTTELAHGDIARATDPNCCHCSPTFSWFWGSQSGKTTMYDVYRGMSSNANLLMFFCSEVGGWRGSGVMPAAISARNMCTCEPPNPSLPSTTRSP